MISKQALNSTHRAQQAQTNESYKLRPCTVHTVLVLQTAGRDLCLCGVCSLDPVTLNKWGNSPDAAVHLSAEKATDGVLQRKQDLAYLGEDALRTMQRNPANMKDGFKITSSARSQDSAVNQRINVQPSLLCC